MVEVDPQTPLIGADGPVTLIDLFDGRCQLVAYFHMWHPGRPTAEQCEGCTFSTTHINELSYLNSRVTDIGRTGAVRRVAHPGPESEWTG